MVNVEFRNFRYVGRKATRRDSRGSEAIMKVLKIMNRLSLIFIFLMGCMKQGSIQQNLPERIEERLLKYNCIDEYNYARFYLYATNYESLCSKLICEQSNIDRKKLFISSEITLDPRFKNCISEQGDTLTFIFSSFINDSCSCIYSANTSFPTAITIKRGTKKILWLGSTAMRVGEYEIPDEIYTKDINMLKFVSAYRSIVNPWFYNELLKRGYLTSDK